jgi:hypothetical protein
MLGTTGPSAPFLGSTDGIKAASAAGRPDGRRQAADDFSKSSRRKQKSGGGMNIALLAFIFGMHPR